MNDLNHFVKLSLEDYEDVCDHSKFLTTLGTNFLTYLFISLFVSIHSEALPGKRSFGKIYQNISQGLHVISTAKLHPIMGVCACISHGTCYMSIFCLAKFDVLHPFVSVLFRQAKI